MAVMEVVGEYGNSPSRLVGCPSSIPYGPSWAPVGSNWAPVGNAAWVGKLLWFLEEIQQSSATVSDAYPIALCGRG